MNATLPLCMARTLAPFAPAASVVHQIVRDDDRALQADLDYLNKLNSGEFERRRDMQAVQLERAHGGAV